MIWTTIENLYQDYIEDIKSLDNHRSNLVTSGVLFGLFSLIVYNLLEAQISQQVVILRYTLASSSIATLVIAVLIYLYPRMQLDTKNRSIEENLLTTTSYMSVLASSGMSIERVLEKVVMIEKNAETLNEFQIFLTDIKLFGKPVTQALHEMAGRSKDSTFSSMLMGMANTINTSGDLSNYLSYETKQLIKRKDEETKSILTKLGYMGEIYIAALVVGPILFIIMLSLLSGLDISTGLSSMTLLNSMVFIGIPIMSLGFLIFLDNVMGGLD